MDTINQADAVKLLWAYLAYEAYRAFSPLAPALEAKDDARRYVADADTLRQGAAVVRRSM